MAEGEDKESKSEDPSAKKRNDAKEEGNLPISRELGTAVLLAGALACYVYLHPLLLKYFAGSLSEFFSNAHLQSFESSADVMQMSLWSISIALFYILPIAFVLMFAGVMAFVAQGASRAHPKKLIPDFSRISLLKGWKRLASGRNVIEFIKSCGKLFAVSAIAAWSIYSESDAISKSMQGDFSTVLISFDRIILKILYSTCAFAVAIAIADVAMTRLFWWRELMMSRQELKDEFKQTEGDPVVKARLRAILRGRRRQRMMSDVPKATVVIANPTHFAIALRYDRGDGGAPVVVAKGTDELALRIREISKKSNVPIVEDKMLARSMYPMVEVGKAIPEEFYRAVAEVIVLIQSRHGAGRRPRL